MASLKKLLVADAPLSYGAMAKYPSSEKLKKQFSTMSRFGDPIQLWEESANGQFLFLPRAVCPIGGDDLRADGHPIALQVSAKPRNDEQARVVKEATELLDDDQSFILQAGTGFGKTVLAIMLVAAVDRTTLIIVPKDDLVSQWRKRLIEHTNLTEKQIGLIQQDRCDVYGKKVVLASLKSLAIPDRYPVDIRKYFGLVVFDEVHRLAADTLQVVCRMFPAVRRLGLSATPKRVDGKEIVLFANIGPIRVVAKSVPMKPKVLRYKSNWVCPRRSVIDETGQKKIVRLPHAPGKCTHVLKYVARDVERNKLLVYLIRRSFENNRRTVVFSHLTDHLELLRTLCQKAGIPSSKMGNYYGSMSEAAMELASTKEVMFATPGKMGEGTDFPWLDAAVLALPLSNIDQIVGRILREYPDKPQPVVFDVLDDDSPVFKGYATTRDEFYQRVGAEVKLMTVQPDALAA